MPPLDLRRLGRDVGFAPGNANENRPFLLVAEGVVEIEDAVRLRSGRRRFLGGRGKSAGENKSDEKGAHGNFAGNDCSRKFHFEPERSLIQERLRGKRATN